MTSGSLPQVTASLSRVFSRWQRFLTTLIVLLVLEALLAVVVRVRVLSKFFSSGEDLGFLHILSSLGLLLVVPMLYAIVRARIAQNELHLLVHSEQDSLSATRTLLDTTAEGIFAIDASGFCILANRAAGELLGYRPEELVGLNMHELVHHTRPDGTPYDVEDCPIFKVISDGRTREVEDDCFWRKDGTSFSVAYSAAAISDGTKTTGAVVSFRDIEERKVWENSMKEAEERTRTFLQDLPLGVFITDQDGRPVYTNNRGAELLGLPADPSLEGADLSQAYQAYVAGTDDLYDPARLPVALAVRGETTTVDDIEVHRPDGSVMPLEVWGGPIRDDEGRIQYAAATFIDISGRKKAAAELEEQADMLDLVEDAVIALDISNRITYWNRTAESIYGWTKEETLGRISYEVLQTTFPKPLEEIKTQILEEGRWEGELSHVRKDGVHVVVASRWVLRRDEAGRPLQILEVNNDITEQKRADEERARQQQLLSAIFETSPDIIATVTKSLQLEYVNPAARQLLGYELNELFGEKSLHWVHPQDLPAAGELLGSAFIAGTTGRNRLRVKTAAEDWIWLDITIRAMGDAGDRAVVMARDITEEVRLEDSLKKAKEAADEASLAKSDFLSRMSHELRTPLNAVLGFAQLLDLEVRTEDHKEAAKEILKGGRHLLDLINEVLDIAAIEARQLSLSLEPVEVTAVAEECLSLLRPLAADAAVTVEIDNRGGDSSAPVVVADRQRLKQVLLNLVSNGIKFNRRGGRVTIRSSPADAESVVIEVVDNGRGIPADGLSRLFAPFDRLGAETSGIEGTGLGLALSKSLVEAMGGSVSVASEQGEGTTFSIQLPRAHEMPAKAETESEEEPRETPEAPAASVASKTILYIEDNLSNVRLIERLARRRGNLKLIPAMQGEMGVMLAREHVPDLILLDVNLPDVSGEEVLLRLHSEPGTADIPVVMLSADATTKQIERLIAAGARDYLTKPIDVARFYEIIDRYIYES